MAEKTVLTWEELRRLGEDSVETEGSWMVSFSHAWEKQVAELEARIAELDAALRIVTVAADKVVGV